jgi:arginyl-tRNA synthetase
VEFVSANPTGPLHVGHGRGAAVGDAVAAVLSASGYDVQREYYINDSGRQIRTLGRSVYLRLLELAGRRVDFPEDGYQGRYIVELAEEIGRSRKEALLAVPEEEAIAECARFAADRILSGIQDDLEQFGVRFDRWYSEQSLYDAERVSSAIESFRTAGRIYEKDGALWFNTTEFGDEKDRVVVRNNGLTTYFASDIAYHQEKFERGFSRVIDVWGADHHGYIPRMTAAVEACGRKREQFQVILVQLVNLMRGGQPVAMSTRAGEFVTLKDVVDEVGKDAARFLFLTRHYESPLDFDLELAKKKSNDNPVYYVQYVHARICSIGKKAEQRGVYASGWDEDAVRRLTEPEEIQLIKVLARFPETVQAAAALLEPHRIAYYLMDLASAFHAYYNKHRVLTDDPILTRGRLCLVEAVRKVIRNGLRLMGVSAPEQM